MNRASTLALQAVLRLKAAWLLITIAFLFVGRALAQDFAPDELIVTFGPKVSDDQKQKVHQANGHKAVRNFKGINGVLIKVKEKETLGEAVAKYRRDPRVQSVEPNY